MDPDLWVQVSEGRFLWLAAAGALAGLVRGFSGFGAAMIFVPVASALYSPPLAVATMFLVDTLISLPLAIGAVRQAQWRPVLLIFAGAAATVPLGAWRLVVRRGRVAGRPRGRRRLRCRR